MDVDLPQGSSPLEPPHDASLAAPFDDERQAWRGVLEVLLMELEPDGCRQGHRLIGVSSIHSSYDAIMTAKWSKNPVSPSSPNAGIHGSQNQTGALHA